MKVFAEFDVIGDTEYRGITILQFGESWNVIGSAVLKNPGSARITKPINIEDYKNYKKLCLNSAKDKDKIFEVLPDSTMRFLEKIFNGSYIEKRIELKGVIQLFNLYTVKSACIEDARELLSKSGTPIAYTSPELIVEMLKEKPVYLGWHQEYLLNAHTKRNAEIIFKYVISRKNNHLDPIMGNNNFYHPAYINRIYKKNMTVKQTLLKFYNEVRIANT